MPRRAARYASFLSTPSARRATTCLFGRWTSTDISIHALREEGDKIFKWTHWPRSYFYPRPPRGGRRPHGITPRERFLLFLSTPSARRATRAEPQTDQPGAISIHALREEGDNARFLYQLHTWVISIHALREEGDLAPLQNLFCVVIFLSTPSARRATAQAALETCVM